MSLRALKKPAAVDKRLKCLFYGTAGSGKTTAAIQFPQPVLVDTEGGAENDQYVKLLDAAGGAYLGPRDGAMDYDVLLKLVTDLLSQKHEYRTLVIDPLTVLYNEMVDRSAEKEGTEFGRHKVEPDRKIKRLLLMLTRLDMNVIITSHAKPQWVRAKDAKGKDTAVQEGNTFDCYGRLDYLFDLVIEVGKRGRERIGTVKKTRIEAFPEGEVFPFNYGEFARRYGADRLEKQAAAVELATEAQQAEVKHLVTLLHIPAETVQKWFDKAGAEAWAEMPAEATSKCIEFLKSQISLSAANAASKE